MNKDAWILITVVIVVYAGLIYLPLEVITGILCAVVSIVILKVIYDELKERGGKK